MAKQVMGNNVGNVSDMLVFFIKRILKDEIRKFMNNENSFRAVLFIFG